MAVAEITRKEQIINTATDLFKDKGFAGTSMRDLATRVGIEAASLYSHISSKDEILQTICFGIAHKFLHHIDQVIAMPEATNEDKLNAAIKGHVKIIIEDTNATSVFWSEWKYMAEPWLTDFSNMQSRYEHKFKSILERGENDNEFSVDDPTFTTMAILSSLNGLQKWRTYTQNPQELGDSFAEMFISGIKSKK